MRQSGGGHWTVQRNDGQKCTQPWRGFPALDVSAGARAAFLALGIFSRSVSTSDSRSRNRVARLGRQWHRGGPQQPSEHPRLRPGSAAKVAICCRGENTLQGEIARMVLINTSSRADSRFHQRLRWRNYLRILQIAMRKDELLVRERAILEMTARGFPRLESLAQDYAAMTPSASANFMRQIFASSRYSYPQAPNCPVLFLASEGDNLVDPVCTRRLARRWQAKLDVHPGADHDLPLLAPDWIIEKVREFLEQAA